MPFYLFTPLPVLSRAIPVWLWLTLTWAVIPATDQELSPPLAIRQQSTLADGQSHPGFEVTHLSAADRQQIKRLASANQPLEAVLGVFVSGQATPVLGRVLSDGDRLVFEPRFALDGNLQYVVRLDIARIRPDWNAGPLQQTLGMAAPATLQPQVLSVLPTSDELPQNLLKMYVRFSRPMNRGQAARHIRFVDASGTEVPEAWLHIPQELWDRDGQQFTVLFDPGRIKRGLARHEQLGLPFQIGQTYTLIVDAAWTSARSQQLAGEFRKTFTIGDPDRMQPDPTAWEITIPHRGTRQPLRLDFGEPLDGSMLEHAIQVLAGVSPVPGDIILENHENRWSLVPDEPWAAGHYDIQIDPRLEDLAGNSIAKPFEIEVGQQGDLSKTSHLEFNIE